MSSFAGVLKDESVRLLLKLVNPESMYSGHLDPAIEEIDPQKLFSVLHLAERVGTLPVIMSLCYKYELGIDESEIDVLQRWWRNLRSHEVMRKQHLSTCKDIVNVLEDRGIAYAAIKGFSLASCYPHGVLRPQGDIDLLVSERDIEKVQDLLLRMGFVQGLIFDLDKGVELFSDTQKNWYRAHCPHLAPFVRISAELGLSEIVEVHLRLNFAFEPYRYNIDELLARTVFDEFRGVSFRTLAPTDNLVFLCGHLYRDNSELHTISDNIGRRLYRILDIVVFSRRYRNKIAWNTLFDVAERYGAVIGVDWCLNIIEELFPGSMPFAGLGLPPFVQDHHRNAVRFGYATGTWDKFDDWPLSYVERIFSDSVEQMASRLQATSAELDLRPRHAETISRRKWLKTRRYAAKRRLEIRSKMNQSTLTRMIETARGASRGREILGDG